MGPTVSGVQVRELFPNTGDAVMVQDVLCDLTSEPVTTREGTCKTASFPSSRIAVNIVFIRLFLSPSDANNNLIVCA